MDLKSCMTLVRRELPDRRDFTKHLVIVSGIALFAKGAAVVERALPDQRRELLNRCFFNSSTMDVVPSDNSDLRSRTVEVGTVWTYPTDQAAVKAIEALCYRPDQIRLREPEDIDLNSSLIYIGSSASNSGTRQILGDPRGLHFDAQCGTKTVEVAYCVEELSDLRAVRYTGNQKREVHVRRLRGHGKIRELRNRSGEPLKNGDLMGDDYLLVTRLPGKSPDTTVTIFGGLHAPAARSLDLLFASLPDDDLKKLAQVASSRFFQAVFHVRGLLEEGDGTTVGTEILLDHNEFPPVPLSEPTDLIDSAKA